MQKEEKLTTFAVMLSKEELKERNSEFWTGFQKEMRNVRSSDGRRINWINYPLQVKDLYLRMESTGKFTRFSLDIQPKDDGVRAILWEQMTELRVVFEDAMGSSGIWEEFDRVFAGRNVSRIYWERTDLNFFNKEDWPEIKAFLKEKLIAFDSFYQEFKDILITLAE
ncbi:MAG: hypothetical protein CSA03_03645 [Bacteroidetes bacterium]|nr:MAG: hypothetical protein CSA03_03645 [Bacteroidota bacterium]